MNLLEILASIPETSGIPSWVFGVIGVSRILLVLYGKELPEKKNGA